jgi:hypothetical protein
LGWAPSNARFPPRAFNPSLTFACSNACPGEEARVRVRARVRVPRVPCALTPYARARAIGGTVHLKPENTCRKRRLETKRLQSRFTRVSVKYTFRVPLREPYTLSSSRVPYIQSSCHGKCACARAQLKGIFGKKHWALGIMNLSSRHALLYFSRQINWLSSSGIMPCFSRLLTLRGMTPHKPNSNKVSMRDAAWALKKMMGSIM